MDIHSQCFSVFKSFTSDIIKVFPEYEEPLEQTYGSLLKLDTCIIEEQELLQEFLDRVNKLNKKITNKDDSMFTDDSLILTNISFKEIWTTNISYKTKENIWKYLQTFCLLSLNHQSNKDLQEALTNLSEDKTIEITDKKVASDVKKIKKMTENIQEPIAEEVHKPGQGSEKDPSMEGNPFAQMEEMMNSSAIGKIAQQVSESLDIESMLGSGSDNPMDIFQKLMSGDAMGKIMNSISSAVNENVENGTINKDSMVDEAQNMYKGLGDNPMFKAMAEMGQQNKQQNKQQNQQQNQPKPSNKTQQRLQKKLKEKAKDTENGKGKGKGKVQVQVNKVDE